MIKARFLLSALVVCVVCAALVNTARAENVYCDAGKMVVEHRKYAPYKDEFYVQMEFYADKAIYKASKIEFLIEDCTGGKCKKLAHEKLYLKEEDGGAYTGRYVPVRMKKRGDRQIRYSIFAKGNLGFRCTSEKLGMQVR